jgi:hypothetical protein
MRWIKNEYLAGAIRKIIWNRTQRTAWLFMATISCALAVHSTTLIVIRRERQITVAGDSRTKYGTQGPTIKVCKIERLNGDVFFAGSGMVLDTRVDGYSANEIALKGKPGTIAFRAAAFAEAIKGPLLQSARWGRQNAPEAVYREFWGGSSAVVLNVVFVGMENRVASISAVDFTKIEDAQGNPVRININIRSCRGSPCGDAEHALIISMGQTDAISNEINSLLTGPGGLPVNDAKTARHLVEMEITDRPDKVGPPISIVQINNSGAHWIDKGVCAQTNNR